MPVRMVAVMVLAAQSPARCGVSRPEVNIGRWRGRPARVAAPRARCRPPP